MRRWTTSVRPLSSRTSRYLPRRSTDAICSPTSASATRVGSIGRVSRGSRISACVIVAPSSTGAIWRRTVSTSGSSGMPSSRQAAGVRPEVGHPSAGYATTSSRIPRSGGRRRRRARRPRERRWPPARLRRRRAHGPRRGRRPRAPCRRVSRSRGRRPRGRSGPPSCGGPRRARARRSPMSSAPSRVTTPSRGAAHGAAGRGHARGRRDRDRRPARGSSARTSRAPLPSSTAASARRRPSSTSIPRSEYASRRRARRRARAR